MVIFTRTILFSTVFLACVLFSHAIIRSKNATFMDNVVLERFKHDLFSSETKDKIQNEFSSTSNDEKCWQELTKIGNGLKQFDEWAMKMLDSWGKFPSAFLDGNLNDLGGFRECLNIELNDSLYESKYCVGEILLEKDEKLFKLSHHYNHMHNTGMIPNIWQSDDDEERIESRAVTSQFDMRPKFKFGMCVPAACSMDYLREFVNFTNKITLSESSCQLRNTDAELRSLDIVAIVLLVIVFVLTICSTVYDIHSTLYNYEKSQIFLAFSVYSNGKKVLSYKKSKAPDTMHCLHGIRAISTQWVVIAHTFVIYAMTPLRNMRAIPSFFSQFHNMIIMSAPIAVDTFFVLSGLLVSINMLKHLKKSGGKINIPLLYFHRYLRLTPLVFAAALVSMTLFRFLGDGPLWPMLTHSIKDQCEKYWWSLLLYVQNYVNPSEICLPHTWYLSVDMQLFIVAPFVVYLMYWFNLKTILFLILSIIGCIAWTVIVHVDYGLKNLMSPNKFQLAYVPTHVRFSSWMVGVIAGYIFLKYQNHSIRIPRIFNLFAWTLSLVMMITVLFINYPLVQVDSTVTPVVYGLYDALSRVCWSIALCYIIFACIHNSGGPINWFLSHPLWQPISRLCYATYLVHFPVIVVLMVTTKTSLYFSELSAFHVFIGNYVLSLWVAFIATLLFESPIVILEKILFNAKKKPESINGTLSNEKYNRMETEQPVTSNNSCEV